MLAVSVDVPHTPRPRINWEAFYRNYRKPGYIPGFEIINKLGGGVFGLVYKARKESIGKDYAIKFLKVDDEVVRDAVLRELEGVRYFAQIDHPNLVSIEDKGEVDGIPFIVMSYAGDETLRSWLDSGAPQRDASLRFFLQAARGVQALHERSLVHFDLKPANIFLKGDIARVGDYGLSKLVSESRNSLSFGRGTPYYMSPEMLHRRGDHRSDIYSLGIILYECLTGGVPFKGDSEWEVLKKHETATPDFPSTLSPVERRVLERCLAKRPEDRFASVADLLREFSAPASLGDSVDLRLLTPPTSPRTLFAGVTSASDGPTAAPSGTVRVDSPPGLEGGALGSLVHAIFRVFELGIFLGLLPIRLASVLFGRGLRALLFLPFRILGASFRLVGYLLVAAMLLLVLVGVMSLVVNFGN